LNTLTKGKLGEQCAVAFLEKSEYRIVERNYRSRQGEIDIIAQKKDKLVFIEVKTWDVYTDIDIEYAVNGEKMNRILQTAKYFLMRHRSYDDYFIRFDLIFITDNMQTIKHIENAFSEV